MKVKLALFTLTLTLLTFAQHADCPVVYVESVQEQLRTNNEGRDTSDFYHYAKVVGCGCESELIRIENKDSQAKIAEKFSSEYSRSCKGSEVEVKELQKFILKKKSWFRRVFGLKAKEKKVYRFEVKLGELVLKQEGKKKNKAMRKFDKCSKKIAKHLGKIEPLLSFADEKDRSTVDKFKADMNHLKLTDLETGKEYDVWELAFKKDLYSFDSNLKCKDRELKKLFRKLKKSSKKK